MKRFMPVLLSALCLILIGVIAQGALPVTETILQDVWDSTNHTLRIEGNVNTPPVNVAATSYTLQSSSKASDYLINYTTTGVVSFIIDTDSLIDGRKFTVKDTQAANTNNITISTEGAETIDGSATYVMNAAKESVTLISDGTNWHVAGAYLE